uniref:Myb-like domain-containing protein n=1 Tax=Brassica oleracea var. oleracea TaxID=109376 RepID=A0A0D3BTZ1_BRAOL
MGRIGYSGTRVREPAFETQVSLFPVETCTTQFIPPLSSSSFDFSTIQQNQSVDLLDDPRLRLAVSVHVIDEESLRVCVLRRSDQERGSRDMSRFFNEEEYNFNKDSVELSSSQVPYSGTQAHEASNFAESPAERRQRRNWTPIDDLVLISAWLNTSKDPVVGNEQRCGTFWKRVAAYFAVSPKVAGSEQRESSNCKQRWQKINDIVNKFCGAYEAAKLRNDQKWRELSTSKTHGSAKRRKCDDGAQSTTSNGTETTNGEEDQGATRPPGVKAAKGQRKKKDVADGKKKDLADGKKLYEFEGMCSIKREDLAMKEKLSKMKLLESLIAKPEPLADYEEALKKKLITDLLA